MTAPRFSVAACALLAFTLLVAPSDGYAAPAPASVVDTLIPTTVPYTGYRLHVRDAKLLRQKRNRYEVAVTVVNTGAKGVNLGPGFPTQLLQTVFDDALAGGGLLPLAPSLRKELLADEVELAPGATLRELTYWVEPTTRASSPAATTDPIEKQYRTRLKTAPADRDQRQETLYASAKPVTPPPAPATADACADLEIASLKVLARDRRSVTVEVAIRNAGSRPLTTGDLGTGTSLDLYLGGGPVITAASQLLTRVNLSARLGAGLGEGLVPGGAVALTERLDVSSATRYTRVLAAQLDPGQIVEECDETNNESTLLLER